MSQLNSKIEDEQAIVMQLQKKIKELQVSSCPSYVSQDEFLFVTH